MAGTGNTAKDGRGSPGLPNAFLARLLPCAAYLMPVTTGEDFRVDTGPDRALLAASVAFAAAAGWRHFTAARR